VNLNGRIQSSRCCQGGTHGGDFVLRSSSCFLHPQRYLPKARSHSMVGRGFVAIASDRAGSAIGLHGIWAFWLSSVVRDGINDVCDIWSQVRCLHHIVQPEVLMSIIYWAGNILCL
jgi:hypothetical protein